MLCIKTNGTKHLWSYVYDNLILFNTIGVNKFKKIKKLLNFTNSFKNSLLEAKNIMSDILKFDIFFLILRKFFFKTLIKKAQLLLNKSALPKQIALWSNIFNGAINFFWRICLWLWSIHWKENILIKALVDKPT